MESSNFIHLFRSKEGVSDRSEVFRENLDPKRPKNFALTTWDLGEGL